MKKMHVLGMFLALVIAFSSVAVTPGGLTASPAVAASTTPITLTITNPLPVATTINLSGPKSYSLYVAKGSTLIRKIDPGKYKYSYAGCLGKKKTGNLKVKAGLSTLAIPPCKMATWTFSNHDKSQSASLVLHGWVSYYETIGPGQTKTVSWVAGDYETTVKVCGNTYSFTWKVKGNKAWYFRAC